MVCIVPIEFDIPSFYALQIFQLSLNLIVIFKVIQPCTPPDAIWVANKEVAMKLKFGWKVLGLFCRQAIKWITWPSTTRHCCQRNIKYIMYFAFGISKYNRNRSWQYVNLFQFIQRNIGLNISNKKRNLHSKLMTWFINNCYVIYKTVPGIWWNSNYQKILSSCSRIT